MRSISMVVLAAALLPLAGPVLGQWATDPTVNTPVADGSGDQGVPLVRATSDGGVWVSFFDNGPGNGYKPAVQRLSASGQRLLPGNGVILANRTNSATFVYDLKVDAADHAIVAFDDNSSGTTVVTVQKVAPDGTLPWGSAGLQIPNTSNVLAPRVAALSDGSYVVAWAASNVLNFQRITASGQFPAGGAWSVAEAGRYQAISDLQAGGASEVVALWVRGETTSAQASRKGLKIQKWNAANEPQWSGGTPIDIYTSSQTPLRSIQNGYFPTIIPDGSGGAIVSFYDNGATRNAWLQHVTSAGTLRFAASGIAVSNTPSSTELRLSAAAAYDPANDEYTVAYQRSNPNQSQFGLSVQRVSAAGNLLWGGGSGNTVISMGGFQSNFVTAYAAPTGASYLLWQQYTGPVTQEIQATALDASGNPSWSPAVLPVSTRFTAKGRLSVAKSAGQPQLIGAWADGPAGDSDVLAQNVNLSGSIGPGACPADFNQDSFVDFFDYSDFVACFEGAGCADGTSADFNRDGFVDFFDYTDFVTAFETGC
jgi:hypothetical protein